MVPFEIQLHRDSWLFPQSQYNLTVMDHTRSWTVDCVDVIVGMSHVATLQKTNKYTEIFFSLEDSNQ